MLYNYKTFPQEIIEAAGVLKRRRGNSGGKKREYKEIVCAFDIETSRLDDKRSFMYIWQFQIGRDHTVIGRSWKEFLRFLDRIRPAVGDAWLVVYVHNLSFEFQFLSGIYRFQPDEVFAVERRKVLRADMQGFVEFRCSYLHSNMRLETYLDKMGVEHQKVEGFDYDKVRYPWTQLSDDELRYCVNDVQGLVEAIEIEMGADGDDLRTIPATSTGYVRRDVKAAMKKVSWPWLKSIMPDPELYEMLREAFRGGNTHANRYMAGQIIPNVKSFDRSSSYPDVQINRRFPMRKFTHLQPPISLDTVKRLINVRKKAVIMRIALEDVQLRDDLTGCPYLAIDKCRHLSGCKPDNGRILMADYLETTVTDVDFAIIERQYKWSHISILAAASSRYGQLPQVLKDCIISYYKAKTELKGVPDQEIFYGKAKNKLNSVYGMSAQNPIKRSTVYGSGDWSEDMTDWHVLLEKSNRKGFFPYQWGVWTSALARAELQRAIDLVGDGFVYCDTDSVKYVGDVDFGPLNKELQDRSTDSGAWADDPKGRRHYMGVWEFDGEYTEFATRGAKKYAARYPDGHLEATIAGVSKRTDGGRVSGGMELEKHGGLKAFLHPSFTFTEAGGVELKYYDGKPEHIRIGKKRLTVGRSVTISPSTYTLTDTDVYSSLLFTVRELSYFLRDKYGMELYT